MKRRQFLTLPLLATPLALALPAVATPGFALDWTGVRSFVMHDYGDYRPVLVMKVCSINGGERVGMLTMFLDGRDAEWDEFKTDADLGWARRYYPEAFTVH